MAGIFRDQLFAGRSGITLRIAERLAEHGARVALFGRTLEKLQRAADAIRQLGGSALPLAGDVRDYAAVQSALAQAHAEFGPIDILVCGAAGNFPAPALGMSSNGFKSVMDIDL